MSEIMCYVKGAVEHKRWLENLKPGDKVAHAERNRYLKTLTVTRVTKTLVITGEGDDEKRFMKSWGDERGDFLGRSIRELPEGVT